MRPKALEVEQRQLLAQLEVHYRLVLISELFPLIIAHIVILVDNFWTARKRKKGDNKPLIFRLLLCFVFHSHEIKFMSDFPPNQFYI